MYADWNLVIPAVLSSFSYLPDDYEDEDDEELIVELEE
jgi:hypothetical protein